MREKERGKVKCLVLGARRRRIGIGEFVARELEKQGGKVVAILGRSKESVRETEEYLKKQYGLSVKGYSSFEEVSSVCFDAVAVCVPTKWHSYFLEKIQGRWHCLLDKPFLWNEGVDNYRRFERIVRSFSKESRWIFPILQWPYTLPYYYRLYPELKGQQIESLSMKLPFFFLGKEGVIDLLPHVVSMCQALWGKGEWEGKQWEEKLSGKQVQGVGYYHHSKGRAKVKVFFYARDLPFLQIGYALNEKWIFRKVTPPWRLWFLGKEEEIEVEDPLSLVVREFLVKCQREPENWEELLSHMWVFQQMVKSIP